MMMDAYMNGIDVPEEDSSARKRRQTSSASNIELMVYVDAEVQNDASQNGFSVIEYILGIINIVSDIWYLLLQLTRKHFIVVVVV